MYPSLGREFVTWSLPGYESTSVISSSTSSPLLLPVELRFGGMFTWGSLPCAGRTLTPPSTAGWDVLSLGWCNECWGCCIDTLGAPAPTPVPSTMAAGPLLLGTRGLPPRTLLLFVLPAYVLYPGSGGLALIGAYLGSRDTCGCAVKVTVFVGGAAPCRGRWGPKVRFRGSSGAFWFCTTATGALSLVPGRKKKNPSFEQEKVIPLLREHFSHLPSNHHVVWFGLFFVWQRWFAAKEPAKALLFLHCAGSPACTDFFSVAPSWICLCTYLVYFAPVCLGCPLHLPAPRRCSGRARCRCWTQLRTTGCPSLPPQHDPLPTTAEKHPSSIPSWPDRSIDLLLK